MAISATFDGESLSIGAKDIAGHLASCPDCRKFEAGVKDLAGQFGLRASRPVPVALPEMLRSEWARAAGTVAAPTRRAAGAQMGWRRPVQWACALTPAVLVAVVLPFGALSNPRADPSHAATPCTAHLVVRR